MSTWYRRFEALVDTLVPIAVVVLLAEIVTEIFFSTFAEHHHLPLLITDYAVLAVFVADLVFKYLRVRNIPKFIRTSWLDIIAVFPFFLIFRVFETVLIFTELQKDLRNVQLIFHESVEISKGTSEIIKEAEEAGKVSRVKTILRMFESLQRSPRLTKAVSFYEHPSGKEQRKIKKEVQKIEKNVIDTEKNIARKLSRKKK